MYKKYFCTFSDSRMNKSLKRIEKQARDLEFFDFISINNENNLNPDFREYFKDKLVKGSRGYGYWVWKPQIILQTLNKMDEGDILLYADAGCHFNKDGIEKLRYYFEKANLSDSGLLVFQETVKSEDINLEVSNCIEKFYTKGDIFDFFNVRENDAIYNTGMIAAGVFFIKKSCTSQIIIEKWLDVFNKNFHLVDDTKSVSSNFNEFIENRHDQSIFSILCKLNKVSSISSSEIWQKDWNSLKYYPILAKRDKHLSIFWKFYRKISSLIKFI